MKLLPALPVTPGPRRLRRRAIEGETKEFCACNAEWSRSGVTVAFSWFRHFWFTD